MIYPTRTAVLAVAAGAPVALVIAVLLPGAWAFAAAWTLVVLLLMGADAVLAPAAGALRLEAAGAVGVGAPFAIRVALERALAGAEVALAVGPRLKPEQDDRLRLAAGEREAVFPYRAVRRGTERIARAWLRWPGPLGLVWRQRETAFDHAVAITPDIRPVRDDGALLLKSAQAGQLARIDRGEGSEFEALTEWRSGMDRRSIDWKQSARHRILLAKETRVERNNQIVFAVDAGRSMVEPVGGVPRVDRAVTAALVGAYVALKLGDRVSLFGFDSRPRVHSGAVTGVRAFAAFQRLAAEIDYGTTETNHTLALATLAESLHRRALIVVFTEVADATGADLMLRAVTGLLAGHLVLFVLMQDEELEALTTAEPVSVDDVSRAVAAAALLRERQLVVMRLRHLGIQVIEPRHDEAGHALVRAYLDFKRRGLL